MREEPLTPEARRDFAKELTDWYYTDGNGIFLSLEAGDLFLKARDLLTQPVIDDESIQRAFSLLKGQMKSDIAVYGPGDLETQIGTKPELRPRKDLAVIASNAPNQGV